MKRLLSPPLLLVSLLTSSHAVVLVSDDFNYADGSIVGQTPASGIGETWAVHSGTSAPPQISSGSAILDQGSGAQDVNSGFGMPITSGQLFYSFDFSINATSAIGTNGTDFEYFASFLRGTTAFAGQLHVVESALGDYTISISNTSTEESDWVAALNLGVNYRVVVGYDFATRISTLWVDPDSELSTSVSSSARSSTINPNAFAFRQSASSDDEVITVDNLIVATTFNEAIPEPSTSLLALLGMTGLLVRRQRK